MKYVFHFLKGALKSVKVMNLNKIHFPVDDVGKHYCIGYLFIYCHICQKKSIQTNTFQV